MVFCAASQSTHVIKSPVNNCNHLPEQASLLLVRDTFLKLNTRRRDTKNFEVVYISRYIIIYLLSMQVSSCIVYRSSKTRGVKNESILIEALETLVGAEGLHVSILYSVKV